MTEAGVFDQQIAVNQPARLHCGDGVVDCEVVSLSRRGAQVRLGAALNAAADAQSDLYLALRGFGQLACRMVDHDGTYADLRFLGDPETQDAVFQEILAHLGDEEGRRQYLRRSVLWPGALKCGENRMECTILNMSLGGAKVALSQERDCTGTVTLYGDRFEGLSATIVWQRGRVIGLQFRAAPGDVARVLGDLLPAIRASA